MSLRREILNEINNMLNEVAPVLVVAAGIASVPVMAIGGTIALLKGKLQDDPRYEQLLNQIPSSSDTKAAATAISKIIRDKTGVTAASKVGDEINRILKAIDDAGPKACNSFVFEWYGVTGKTEYQEAMKSNGGILPKKYTDQFYMPYVDVAKLGSGQKDQARTHIWNIWHKAAEATGDSPTPKPKPQTCPDGTPAPGGDVSKCPKKEMARSGLCKPPYVGKNGGVSQGPAVQQVQEILANPKIGLLKNAQFTPGQVDTATNNAIFSLQEKLAPLGSKIASGLGGTYDGQAIKPDGCYGPKTSCAVSLYYGLPDVYNKGKKKCMAILGIKAKALAKASGEVGFPASKGMVDLEESKNWADRTRESASTSLFERLVKDVSNKKVI